MFIPPDPHKLIGDLRAESKARTRTLTADDVIEFVERIALVIRDCPEHLVPRLSGRITGGTVAKAYSRKGVATADVVAIGATADSGPTTLVASRGPARAPRAIGIDGHNLSDVDRDELKARGWTAAGGVWRPAVRS